MYTVSQYFCEHTLSFAGARLFESFVCALVAQYWLSAEPDFGAQGVFLESRFDDFVEYPNDTSTWTITMDDLVAKGVKVCGALDMLSRQTEAHHTVYQGRCRIRLCLGNSSFADCNTGVGAFRRDRPMVENRIMFEAGS